jgi:feruloyl-CoA synthase
LHAAIGAHNARAAGTSTRIRRLLVLDTPPCADAGEINEKGYVNQHAARRVRAAAIERLYSVPPDPEVTEFSC